MAIYRVYKDVSCIGLWCNPDIDYCTVVWAECCKDDASKLERIQKARMQLILDEGWECPSSALRGLVITGQQTEADES